MWRFCRGGRCFVIVSGDFECKGAFGGVSKLIDSAVKWLEYGGAFLGIVVCVDLFLAFGRLRQK